MCQDICGLWSESHYSYMWCCRRSDGCDLKSCTWPSLVRAIHGTLLVFVRPNTQDMVPWSMSRILNLVLWSMNHILNLILIMIHCVIPLWIIFDILSLLLIALYPFNLTYIRHLTQWCVLLQYYFDISTYWTIQIIVYYLAIFQINCSNY